LAFPGWCRIDEDPQVHRIYSPFLTKLLCTRIFSQALAVVRSMAVQNGQVQAGVGFGMCLLGIFLFGEKKPLGKLLGNRSATFRHLHCNGSEVFGSMLRIYQSYPHPTTSEDRIYTKYTTSSPSSGRGTFGSSKLSQKKATI